MSNTHENIDRTIKCSHRFSYVCNNSHRLRAFILLAACSIAFSVNLKAATFLVDTETDALDQNPGDGICVTDMGECSLRAAIIETNALAGEDLIQVPPGYYLLTLAGDGEDEALSGDLDIRDNLTIEGINPFATTIDGGQQDRVFDVGPNVEDFDVPGISVTLRLLRVTNGDSNSGGGGGILYHSELQLEYMILVENVSSGPGGGVGNSNGFFDNPSLDVLGSIISLNRAEFGNGGGIAADTVVSVSVRDSIVIANHASGGGGGMWVNGSVDNPAIIDRTTIYGNSTSGGILSAGGGIRGSCFHISNSDISQNRIGEFGSDQIGAAGGGIQNTGNCGAYIENSTLHGNLAEVGGAIGNSGSLTLENVTIARNGVTDEGGGIFQFGGGSQTDLTNTIIAENFPQDCEGLAVTSNGHNIGSDNSCSLFAAGDLTNTDPQLGPLNLNGGPTRTLALLAGSPAIDAGTDTGLSTDQRGVFRPQGAAFDIGAYEHEPSRESRLRRRCDINRDRLVNSRDLDAILAHIKSPLDRSSSMLSGTGQDKSARYNQSLLDERKGGKNSRADINRDGRVSTEDYQICVKACTNPGC